MFNKKTDKRIKDLEDKVADQEHLINLLSQTILEYIKCSTDANVSISKGFDCYNQGFEMVGKIIRYTIFTMADATGMDREVALESVRAMFADTKISRQEIDRLLD